MENKFNNRAQVTMFVIVGIVIVVGILMFFFLADGGGIIVDSTPSNPRSFVQSCVEDAVEGAIENIYRNGGEIESSFSIMYDGYPYNYLCHTADNYATCYNLHPLLELKIEERIKEDTLDDVQTCFDALRQDLENKGFDVNGGSTEYSIDLLPGSVDVNLKKDITATKGSSSESYNDFDSRIVTPLYELVKVAKTIVTSESRFCAFERNGFMIFYPEFDIKKVNYDNSKIYSVRDRNSGHEFKFAIRTCAVPAGF